MARLTLSPLRERVACAAGRERGRAQPKNAPSPGSLRSPPSPAPKSDVSDLGTKNVQIGNTRSGLGGGNTRATLVLRSRIGCAVRDDHRVNEKGVTVVTCHYRP